jgi:hypothetical protein
LEKLNLALAKIQTVVTIINDGARQAETIKKVLELQVKLGSKTNIVAPSRILLLSGLADIPNSRAEFRTREVYLFNDMLIVVKPEGERSKILNMCPFVSFGTIPVQEKGGTLL